MTVSIITELLGSDPLSWLMNSNEPYARWVTLASLLRRPADDPEVRRAHAQTLADPGVRMFAEELPRWGESDTAAHHSAAYLPNRLGLLADMGVRGGDLTQVEEALDELLAHQDESGRFGTYGLPSGEDTGGRASLSCDMYAVTDVLLRFERTGEERVAVALERIEKDAARTPQGRAWRCVPEKRNLWRGPGRRADACPQVTLEALRVFSHLAPSERPEWLAEAARTPLEIWRRRTEERPYAFGHGYQFKSVKWPNFWYDVLAVLEAVGRYPETWTADHATAEDRRSVAELAACLIAYNFDAQGRVVPRRIYRGFERFSFGQKKRPSPFATARALVALSRLDGLAEDIARVDVSSLASSKGGAGKAVPPKHPPPLCPLPPSPARFPETNALARVLARHHIATPWVPASVDSVVADIVGINATSPTAPYLALFARLPGFTKRQIETALYDRRSLVHLRCMRGNVMVVRRNHVAFLFAATRRQTSRYARNYSEFRGVTQEVFEHFAPRVLELTSAQPLTTAQLRERLPDAHGVDVAALVSRMSTECLLARDRPLGGWDDRHWTYVPFSQAFPEIDLDLFAEEDADVALVREYVRAYGPATPKDAAWWTGIGSRRTERALRRLGDEVVSVHVAPSSGEHLMHAADMDELPAATMPASPAVVFLPALDPLMMGYAEKRRLVADDFRHRVFDRSGGMTSTFLLDGRVAGIWNVAEEQEPTLLLHALDELDVRTTRAVLGRALELARFWYDGDAGVEWVDAAEPLADRPAGALFRPLR